MRAVSKIQEYPLKRHESMIITLALPFRLGPIPALSGLCSSVQILSQCSRSASVQTGSYSIPLRGVPVKVRRLIMHIPSPMR